MKLSHSFISIISAAMLVALPVIASAGEGASKDGPRMQERWQRMYEKATPEQKAVMDQRKAEFEALPPEEKAARLREMQEKRGAFQDKMQERSRAN